MRLIKKIILDRQKYVFSIILTLVTYLILKYSGEMMLYRILVLPFGLYAHFGDVTFAVPWSNMLIPGIVTWLFLKYKKIQIWDLDDVIKESFIGFVCGISLEFLMFIESLVFGFNLIDTIITFIVGIFIICPPIWFVTLITILVFIGEPKRKPKIFKRKIRKKSSKK